MEILNVEVEGLEEPLGNQSSKRKATNDNIAEKNAEKKRVIGLAERLTVDLKKCVRIILCFQQVNSLYERRNILLILGM